MNNPNTEIESSEQLPFNLVVFCVQFLGRIVLAINLLVPGAIIFCLITRRYINGLIYTGYGFISPIETAYYSVLVSGWGAIGVLIFSVSFLRRVPDSHRFLVYSTIRMMIFILILTVLEYSPISELI